MSPNRGGTLASRPTDATPRRDENTDTAELDRLVGQRRPAIWGNPKLAVGGGLAALVALVALGVTQVNLSPASNDDEVAQAPVDVTPAPEDVPSEGPAVTALPTAPIDSDRGVGSPGAVVPVLPAASKVEATATCAEGSCSVRATFELNVSAARLEAVAGASRVALPDPGTAGQREVTFTLPADSGCFRIEALDRSGKTGTPSNELCVAADGTVSPPSQ